MIDHSRMLGLIAAPRAAYRLTTDELEQALARVPALQHGRRPGDSVFDCAEALRVELCAVARARAARRASEAQALRTMADKATQAPTQGGARVCLPGPAPKPLPPTRVAEPEGAL